MAVASETAVLIEKLVIRYGETTAVRGIDLRMRAGEHFTLLGASGCGKTTTLRAIAGLERPTSGRIELFGSIVFDSARGIDVPAEERGVSMVFQSYAIWPHMSVFDNVAYGLRVRKVAKEALRRRTMDALSLVGLTELADRPASNLSGGQQQRVALARSFVFEPKVLLFDEPLSNLDAKLRAYMRLELQELERRLGLTSVYVTHDQEEALAMSDTIAVMEQGKVEQVADPFTLYYRPVNRFVANFIGASNILSARIVALDGVTAVVRLTNGAQLRCQARADDQPWRVVPDEAVEVAVKTVHLRLARVPAEQAEDNAATIRRRVFVGDYMEYLVDWAGLELRVRQPSLELLDVGERVAITIDPAVAVLLPIE